MLDYQFLKSNIFNLVNVDAQKVLDSIQEDESAKNEEGGPKKRKKLEDFTPQERMIRRFVHVCTLSLEWFYIYALLFGRWVCCSSFW